ncbi:hypothetical protein JCM24511_04884 [Saitozyma sp. JCM 24511]|nr:hypothetical protein JCM24511_04884 [Saitozyma sp. JCM 24511]
MDSATSVPSSGPIPSVTPHESDGHDGQVGSEAEVAPTARAGQRAVAGLPSSSTIPAGTPSTSVPPTPATGFPGQVNAVAGPSSRPDASVGVEVEVDVDGIGKTLTPALKPEVDAIARESGVRKRKWAARGYAQDEMDEMERRATALHLALAMDQQSTLYPPAPSPFTSYGDVVDRLLPYHIWQIHDEELDLDRGDEKAKHKERMETHEAADLVRRIVGVRDRFAKLRRRSGQHSSDIATFIPELIETTRSLRTEVSERQQKLSSLRPQLTAYENKEKARLEEIRRAEERRLAEEKRLAEERRRAEEEARARAAAAEAARRPKPVVQTTSTPVPKTTISISNGPASVAGRPAGSPASAKAPAVVPVRTTAASTPATPTTTPSTPTPERGRPRGRPRGRGRGGLREAVLTHTPAGKSGGGIAPTTPSTPLTSASSTPSAPSTPSVTNTPRQASAAGPAASAGTPAATPTTPQTPAAKKVTLTLPMHIINGMVQAGIVPAATPTPTPSPLPAGEVAPPAKTPGTVLRMAPDNTGALVFIDLAACSREQVQSLAKLLNIEGGKGPKGSASVGAGVATGTSKVEGSAANK